MMKILCANCLSLGYCKNSISRIVEDHELANPEFIRDVRAYAYSLQLKPSEWLPYIADEYMRFEGRIVSDNAQEQFLDMDIFEVCDNTLLEPTGSNNAEADKERIRYWFKMFCCTPCSTDVLPRVRLESRERIRVLATILRARNPQAALMWGVRAANDNEPD